MANALSTRFFLDIDATNPQLFRLGEVVESWNRDHTSLSVDTVSSSFHLQYEQFLPYLTEFDNCALNCQYQEEKKYEVDQGFRKEFGRRGYVSFGNGSTFMSATYVAAYASSQKVASVMDLLGNNLLQMKKFAKYLCGCLNEYNFEKLEYLVDAELAADPEWKRLTVQKREDFEAFLQEKIEGNRFFHMKLLLIFITFNL